MRLTSDNIHKAATPSGGFTHAQIQFLGFLPTEKWLKKAVGMNISKEDYQIFINYGRVGSKELKSMKEDGSFKTINSQQKLTSISDSSLFNSPGVPTGVYDREQNEVCVGDEVVFWFNEHFGYVEAVVEFSHGSFVARITSNISIMGSVYILGNHSDALQIKQ